MTERDWLLGQTRTLSAYIREQYARNAAIAVDTKRDASDLLTEVDLTVQQRLVEAIRAEFPDDHIVAEESGMDIEPDDRSARAWIIDPVDGTQNFVRGFFPCFAISVALIENEHPICAVIASPVAEWDFTATQETRTTQNGIDVCVSDTQTLEAAQVEVDFCHVRARGDLMEQYTALLAGAGAIRSHGSAAMGLAAIATGQNDAYINPGAAPWDVAAGILLVEQAGGRVTNFDGEPMSVYDSRDGIIATNGHLHDAMLQCRREGG